MRCSNIYGYDLIHPEGAINHTAKLEQDGYYIGPNYTLPSNLVYVEGSYTKDFAGDYQLYWSDSYGTHH